MAFNMTTLKTGLKVVQSYISKNSPTICIALGTALMAGGTVKAIVESPKAKEKLDILEDDDELSHREYLKEKAQVILYHYWATAGMTLGGAALIFWGHKISLGRTAAALAAYQMSKDDLKKLEDKIVELDGEKHLEKAKDEIARDRVLNDSQDDEKVKHIGDGDILFIDGITGQKFRSSFDKIDRAVNALNAEIHSDPELTASLNTWLDLIGCENSKVGDKLGWRFSRQGQNVDIKYRCVRKPNEEVSHVIEYNIKPLWDFDIIESSDRNADYEW